MDLRDFSGLLSSALGRGLRASAAGAAQRNTFSLFLRDRFGNVIPPAYVEPLVGHRYLRDCGYPYPELPSGEPTTGYGVVDGGLHGAAHGCRLAFHLYVVDGGGRPLRPARGFRVLQLEGEVEGSIRVGYAVGEAGAHHMYVRYLPSDDAGARLHDPGGALALAAKNVSREGQIDGSPFAVRVSPGLPDAAASRADGPGLARAVMGGADDWARFEVATRDAAGNLAPCTAADVDVEVTGPDGEAVAVRVEGANASALQLACRVFYRPLRVGVYSVGALVRRFPVPGAPFAPRAYDPPPPLLSYSVDTPRPSPRTNRTRRVPLAGTTAPAASPSRAPSRPLWPPARSCRATSRARRRRTRRMRRSAARGRPPAGRCGCRCPCATSGAG